MPVRWGNAAADQHQLDGCGGVLDAAWRLTEARHRLYLETWPTLAGFADTLADPWRDPDAGIWEVCSDARHHAHSNLLEWLVQALARSARARAADALLRDLLALANPRGLCAEEMGPRPACT